MANTVEIPLTRGKIAIIDEDDLALVSGFSWQATPTNTSNGGFYAVAKTKTHQRTSYSSKHITMHRLLLGFPDGDIDHINHNGLDNRRENLRLATRPMNNGNARKTAFKKTSRYKGVSFDVRRNKWVSQISPGGKTQYLGRFINEEDAAHAYDMAAVKVFGEFALTNFSVL